MTDVIKIAQELLRKPSVTPHDNGAIDYLAEFLKQNGFATHILEFSEPNKAPIKNLYAKKGSGSPHLAFAGHTDVVPVGNEADWQVPPFSAEIIDGEVIARGAVDMKGAIAAFVAAALKADISHGTISFIITGDEEAEAVNGTIKLMKWIADHGDVIDDCIIGEPTTPNKLGEIIKIGSRGSANFHLTVSGIQGHVAYPQDNPITKLVNILHDLKTTNFDSGDDKFQPTNLEPVDLEVGNDTVNLIPARAIAKFNVRYNNHYTPETLKNKVEEICKNHTHDFVLKMEIGAHLYFVEPNKFTDLISKACKEITGITPELTARGATSDARFIKDYCTVVEFGLPQGLAHQVNERVAIVDLQTLEKIYNQIIVNYFG
ncbi:MAG: succinyl-diaminopimelate desuccinylase [Rickettsiales bacterium]